MLLSAAGMWVTLEQPSTSLLQYHDRMQQLLAYTSIFEIRFSMWNYGAPTQKATVVYSNRRWIDDILQHQIDRTGDVPANSLVNRWIDSSGRARFRGNPALKSTRYRCIATAASLYLIVLVSF